jgi:hypothetical protein
MIKHNPNVEVQQEMLDLPKMVQDVVKHFDTPLQRKMALASTLTIVGSLMPQVYFNYENGRHYPSLYTVIVLPPASGKGSTGKIEIVLWRVNEAQLLDVKRLKAQYKRQMREYERAIRDGQEAEIPVKPKYPLLKIPGNITSSKFIEQLQENDEKMFALIFESEIDALTNMMGNSQFGKDNSMVLRKAYHNESISLMRKNGDHYDIQSPKLSIVLTGTPSQLSGLFSSIEDGLFSRFLIVNADVPMVWKNVQPCDTCDPIEVKLGKLSYQFFSFYEKMKDQKVEFKMTDVQWSRINQFGEERLKTSFEDGGEYATSIAKRHAVMLARIACILSMVRYCEAGSLDTVWYCEDRDFATALSIVTESFESSMNVFHILKEKKSAKKGTRIEEFFEHLPMRFKRKELAPIMKTLGISERNMDRFLSELLDSKQLRSPSKGYYEKHMMAEMADGKNYSQNAPLE